MAARRVRKDPMIQDSGDSVKEPVYRQMDMAEKKNFFSSGLFNVIVFVVGIALGSMWTKIQYLEKNGTTSGTTANTANTQQQQTAAQPAAAQLTDQQLKDLFANKQVVKFGNTNAKNLLVEFGDPSCPYCHVAEGLNPELNNQIGSQFKLVSDGGSYVAPVVEMRKLVDQGQAAMAWVYTPGHGNGELGAKALFCANDEGKFWQVSDILMTNKGYDFMNNQVKNDMSKVDQMIAFVAPAISSAQFANCMKNDTYKTRLTDDTSLATSMGVQGTPGFFINTTRFDGAYNWNDMKSAVK